MQFQVPQFIETEDKVVGPFSIRQFAYVGVACFVSAIFFFMVSLWLSIIIGIILIGGSIALSFVKIEGRSLSHIILSAANFYWKPQTYVWQPEHAPLAAATPAATPRATPATPAAPPIPKAHGVPAKQLESIIEGSSLRKKWQSVQTGENRKSSDRQFLERKMDERYQIFRRNSGERDAARRVDYR